MQAKGLSRVFSNTTLQKHQFFAFFTVQLSHPYVTTRKTIAKTGTIKNRNSMDLTEAEDSKKRWQQYTELCKKDLYDPDNHNSVITHLEPDTLECEVKWA